MCARNFADAAPNAQLARGIHSHSWIAAFGVKGYAVPRLDGVGRTMHVARLRLSLIHTGARTCVVCACLVVRCFSGSVCGVVQNDPVSSLKTGENIELTSP